jgi:polysaccharide biosynthesis protein PslH
VKIAVVSPNATHPPLAGNRARILALVEALQTLGHEVHLLHVLRDVGDIAAMQAAWVGRYWPIPYRRPSPAKGLKHSLVRWSGRLLGRPDWYRWGIDDWYDEHATPRLRQLADTLQFDAVVVEYVYMSKALDCFADRVFKLIDTHDVMTDRHRIFIANDRRPHWFSTTAAEEGRGLNRADMVIAIQDAEREFLQTITARPVIVVGHLCSVDEVWSPGRSDEPGRILFVGSDNAVNIDAINWFLSGPWPQIRARRPGVELRVAGKVCNFVSEAEGISKLGVVTNITDAYRDATLVINPVTYGTGLNIKSIEALSHGMPLVATPAGARGLEPNTEAAWITAADAREFVDQTLQVLSDRELAERLARGAAKFARNWNVCHARELAAVLERCGPRIAERSR